MTSQQTWAALTLTLTLVACNGDPDARCGDNQVLDTQETCSCAPGYAFDDSLTCASTASETHDAGMSLADAGSMPDAGTSTTSLERPCTSHDDCGEDAPFCDTFHYDMCVIDDCTIQPESCPGGWMCCDFTRFGLMENLCVRDGECPTR